MAKLNYTFDTPVPSYFRDNGWMTNPLMAAYISWAFSRCSSESRKFYFINKEVHLDAFEYISGLRTCSIDTGLTHREIRTQQDKLISAGYLEKSTSKSTNKYTVYKWVMSHFTKNTDKQNDTRATSKRQASDNNLDYIEYIDLDTPPPTSSIEEAEGRRSPTADRDQVARLIALSQKHSFPFSAVAIADAADKFGIQNLEFALADFQNRKPAEKTLRSPNGWLMKTTKKFMELTYGN